jgi:hypothetical protein
MERQGVAVHPFRTATNGKEEKKKNKRKKENIEKSGSSEANGTTHVFLETAYLFEKDESAEEFFEAPWDKTLTVSGDSPPHV